MKANILKVKVKFFGGMSQVFKENERQIDLRNASNVQELLNLLCYSYEQRKRIFYQSNGIRADVSILKNGRNIYFLDGTQTELEDGDTVAIFPLMVGG